MTTWPEGAPPPHAPGARLCIERVGHWEVRAFDPRGSLHRYFSPRGLLHLQLWHPALDLSLLSPSRLTGYRYEIFPIAGWKWATRDYERLRHRTREAGWPRLPDPQRMQSLEARHVAVHERACLDDGVSAEIATRLCASSAHCNKEV
ncbi:MAG: hypothetical protein MJE66_24325 [Proteobacteria bacterium]|nr:hypothetical protein [Pseudomonadota bacterium]